MNSEIYIIKKKIKITNPHKQQAFIVGPKYRAQNERHKQGVQSIGLPTFFAHQFAHHSQQIILKLTDQINFQ